MLTGIYLQTGIVSIRIYSTFNLIGIIACSVYILLLYFIHKPSYQKYSYNNAKRRPQIANPTNIYSHSYAIKPGSPENDKHDSNNKSSHTRIIKRGK